MSVKYYICIAIYSKHPACLVYVNIQITVLKCLTRVSDIYNQDMSAITSDIKCNGVSNHADNMSQWHVTKVLHNDHMTNEQQCCIV